MPEQSKPKTKSLLTKYRMGSREPEVVKAHNDYNKQYNKERKQWQNSPGGILSELYLNPKGISVKDFAKACGISRRHISDIVNERVRVTARTAARIAEVLGTSAQYWLNLQNAVDLENICLQEESKAENCRSRKDKRKNSD